MFFFTTFHGSKLFKSSLAIIWLQESLTCSCSSVSFSLCYDPWVDKMFCSLGYRLRSRVALGIGKVVIMYCKFLMEYVYIKKKKSSTKHRRYELAKSKFTVHPKPEVLKRA